MAQARSGSAPSAHALWSTEPLDTALGGRPARIGGFGDRAFEELPTRSPEERLEELMEGGLSRSAALNQLAQENMEADLQELTESWQTGVAMHEAMMRLQGWRFHCASCALCLLTIVYLVWCFVAAYTVVMNITGFFLTAWLVNCEHHVRLRAWLLALQLTNCLDGGVMGCLRSHRPDLVARIRMAKWCSALFTVFGVSLRLAWCWSAWHLARAEDRTEEGCGKMLPRFLECFALGHGIQLLGLAFITLTFFPCQALARRGLLGRAGPSGEEILKGLEVVAYDPELFADPEDPQDNRPHADCCCCCLENYNQEREIVRLCCQHMMHRECVGRWLRTSYRCPMCRADLRPEHDGAAGDSSQELAHLSAPLVYAV